MAPLREWRAVGIPLANHTWSHLNLDQIGTADYEREITLDEPVLRTLANGSDWHWFRYPFLAEGQDAARRAGIRSFLAELHVGDGVAGLLPQVSAFDQRRRALGQVVDRQRAPVEQHHHGRLAERQHRLRQVVLLADGVERRTVT